ncbi:biotin--[acetyl-CoA-carboxylase] ligase [Thalassospira povalilytica]|uniref:biotin--[acetyl-CoA-carboxylase] ligase n=1 Tax=Thalassospira povalilytica TaxID=732237 RepID=UPI001D187180|nr:biotin--[acetyl-CoA-carboxylase] ligase [Thalassospira povalilytica]MCC4240880.1 biotin--[acetyl-CoA-carboxylase] ligase [Thalassospira povalilytica]
MTARTIRLPEGFHLHELEAIDSTNDEAKRLADKGAQSGALVLARTQTSGRGRRGRAWSSPVGNLYSSLLLRPTCSLAEAARLTFLIAVSMAEAVEMVTGNQVRPDCKWPNDLMVNGRKICGILLESASNQGSATDYLVIGTGVNVAFAPDDAERPATSLSALGAPVSVDELVSTYLARIAHWLPIWEDKGFGPVREAWLSRGYGIGQPVVARLTERELSGTFVGLDDDGSLVLREDSGTEHRIGAGEVFFATGSE